MPLIIPALAISFFGAAALQIAKEKRASHWPKGKKPKDFHGFFNIAIIGNSGYGKSSLMNAIIEDRVAPVSVQGEGTLKPTAHVITNKRWKILPEDVKLRFVDMPGCGTEEHPIETYVQDKNIRWFDAVILLTGNRPRVEDARLFKLLTAGEEFPAIPTLLCQSKADQLLNEYFENDMAMWAYDIDSKDPEAVEFANEHYQFLKNNLMDKFGLVLNEERCFIVSSKRKYRNRWELSRLRKKLVETVLDSRLECAICLEAEPNKRQYNSLEKEWVITNCGHIFHRECMKHWTNKVKNNCPLCRKSLGCFGVRTAKWNRMPMCPCST